MAGLTVLGIGNVLMRDDGVGIRLMEAVRDARRWPDDVEFVDGGAGGMGLLNLIEQAERLVVFDAADLGLSPGAWRVVRPEQLADDVPAGRVGLHDLRFVETLRLCEKLLRRPPTVLLAIQPAEVDYGRELSGPVRAAFERLVRAGVELVGKER